MVSALDASWGSPGTSLAPLVGSCGGSWRFLGGLLGLAWAAWAPLDVSRDHLGSLLGPACWPLGVSRWLLASLWNLLARFFLLSYTSCLRLRCGVVFYGFWSLISFSYVFLDVLRFSPLCDRKFYSTAPANWPVCILDRRPLTVVREVRCC